jgi:hypothetical protein
MDLKQELKSAGVYPSGPCSAIPRERNEELVKKTASVQGQRKKNFPGVGQMAKGLVKTAGQAVMHGKVSSEVREERYDTCKACPLFDAESKRCTDCGCFMEAKTWVGGDPDMLCPQKKWSR